MGGDHEGVPVLLRPRAEGPARDPGGGPHARMTLIWLNGPFGGGKTQTAQELYRRLPGSVVCDPEHPGFGLRRMLPPSLRGDFQDLASWRAGVVEVLDLALRKHNGPVIAPMTVINPDYFEE